MIIHFFLIIKTYSSLIVYALFSSSLLWIHITIINWIVNVMNFYIHLCMLLFMLNCNRHMLYACHPILWKSKYTIVDLVTKAVASVMFWKAIYVCRIVLDVSSSTYTINSIITIILESYIKFSDTTFFIRDIF